MKQIRSICYYGNTSLWFYRQKGRDLGGRKAFWDFYFGKGAAALTSFSLLFCRAGMFVWRLEE